MALSQQHRASIFTTLVPILGQEEAEALLSQFPSRDLDEPVTKDFVRAEVTDLRGALRPEIGDLRTEMHSEIGALRTEMRTEFGRVRTEMSTEFGRVRNEIADLRADMYDRFRQHTMWIAGTNVVAVTLATVLSRLLG